MFFVFAENTETYSIAPRFPRGRVVKGTRGHAAKRYIYPRIETVHAPRTETVHVATHPRGHAPKRYIHLRTETVRVTTHPNGTRTATVHLLFRFISASEIGLSFLVVFWSESGLMLAPVLEPLC